jgi:hypothetical protein
VPAFDYHGLDLGSDAVESQAPDLELPFFLQDRRERLGDELLREGST